MENVQNKSSNPRLRGVFGPVIITFIIVAIFVGTIVAIYSGIHPVMIIHAGDPPITAQDYLIDKDTEACFQGTQPGELTLPGTYIYMLKTKYLIRPVILKIVDPEKEGSAESNHFSFGLVAYADEKPVNTNPIVSNLGDDEENIAENEGKDIKAQVKNTEGEKLLNVVNSVSEKPSIPVPNDGGDEEYTQPVSRPEKPPKPAKNSTPAPSPSPAASQEPAQVILPETGENINKENASSEIDVSAPVFEADDNPFGLDEFYYNLLTENERKVLMRTYTLLQLHGYDENSYRFKAIKLGLTMLHWGYSKDYRWDYYVNEDGSIWGRRDCSSFVYTCYHPFVTYLNDTNTTTTTSLFNTQKEKGGSRKYDDIITALIQKFEIDDRTWYKEIDDYELGLIPGDIILCTGNWERIEGIGHTMIYLGNGYVLHAIGTWEDGVLIEKYDGWNRIGDASDRVPGPRYVISIPDSYDKHVAFDIKYRDFLNNE